LLSWDAVATVPLMFALELLPRKYASLFQQLNLSDSDLDLFKIDESVYHMWHTRKWQKQSQRSGPVHSLLMNMALTQPLQCWDARDRIYALLAISRDTDVLEIVPDYSASLYSVFLKTSVSILQIFHRLEPLVHALRWVRNASEPGNLRLVAALGFAATLPSWALRPSTPLDARNLVFQAFKPHPRTFFRIKPSNFRLDHCVLILKGRILDSIAMSSPTFLATPLNSLELDVSRLTTEARLMLHWRAMLLYLGLTTRNVASLCRVIVATPHWVPIRQVGRSSDESATFQFVCTCRALVLSHLSRPFSVTHDIKALIKQCSSFVQELVKTFPDDQPNPQRFTADTPLTPQQVEAANDLVVAVLYRGRSFCVTDGGRLCNAMHDPQKGDVVAAFQGGDRLFILRPVGHRFRLVGDAFVDGWMEGEAYEGLDPDEVDYDIELV